MEPFSAIPAQHMQYYDFPEQFSSYVRQKQAQEQFQRQPCRDWVCLILLIVAVGGFFGYGGYLIYRASQYGIITTLPILTAPMREVVGIVLGMMGLSIGFSAAILIVLRYSPLAGLWILVGLTLGGLAGLVIVLFYYQMTSVGIVVAVLLAISIICVICYSSRMEPMAKLLYTVTIFLEQRKKVFFATLICLLFGIGFMVFWIISYYSMYGLNVLNILNDTDYTVAFVFWIILGTLWSFWFYYAIVYIVGAQTALWFYNSERTPVATPIMWLLKGSLGTVTFGSAILAFVKGFDIILSISLKGSRDREQSIGNAIFKCCVCIVQCCMRGVYVYFKILNNFTMIVCSLTGQSYLVGVKLAGYLLFRNYDMFQLIKLTSHFVYIGGLVVSCGIPTFIGVYLLQSKLLPQYFIIICGAVIFCISMIVGIVIFATLVEAVNSMFVIYSFERCKHELGVNINRVLPHQNRLDEHFRNNFPEQMNPNPNPNPYPRSSPNPPPLNISEQNIGNQVYNYPNNQAYPAPYNPNARFSQQLQNNNQPANNGFPLGYPL